MSKARLSCLSMNKTADVLTRSLRLQKTASQTKTAKRWLDDQTLIKLCARTRKRK